MSLLLKGLRDHLASLGIVRVPKDAGDVPPLWLDPQDGVPAPGEGNAPNEVDPDMVLGAYITGGFAPVAYEAAWLRTPIVDIRFRARTSPLVETTELAITGALVDRRDWMMGDVYVIECEQWNALSRISSDTQGFDYRVSYWFQLPRATAP